MPVYTAVTLFQMVQIAAKCIGIFGVNVLAHVLAILFFTTLMAMDKLQALKDIFVPMWINAMLPQPLEFSRFFHYIRFNELRIGVVDCNILL